MKPRLNANSWVLAVFLVVLILVGIDLGNRYLREARATAAENAETARPPDPKVGDVAPDFELADSKDRMHRLSDLVKRDTILCFTCGCAQCRGMQTYLAKVRKKMGEDAPDVISVTTSPPDAEEAYIRDTGLVHTILYHPRDADVMRTYRGKPCPRLYRLDGTRRITWVGPSLEDEPYLPDMAVKLVHELGFRAERDKGMTDRPLAPKVTPEELGFAGPMPRVHPLQRPKGWKPNQSGNIPLPPSLLPKPPPGAPPYVGTS